MTERPASPVQPRDRWDALCRRVGAFGKPEEADLTFEMLSTMYGHPVRAYHNLDHIAFCLVLFDEVSSLAEQRDEVEFAIWLHDCVFFSERPDNEARSAEAAGMIAALLGCKPEFVERVKDLIAVTRHNHEPERGDAALIADIDLAILGADPETYDQYRHAIRKEFAYADDAMFRAGRTAFLERMLGRTRIFSTAYFKQRYDARARANLEHELNELERGTHA